ncbi:acetyl/propionyl-CoA carboxylase subunit alpha [Arthrobacter sp. MYb227]|uniref:acetyl/propionyl/methylcrotonyl-CoA carboxylase subunit alpha n=1 Tax=Arthrobacter sp. MYb227 TaxID=1848601 RepID=UPI000CFCCF80|nr:biotin carboxylase N-terminal domain-containing protein [Arthrobacter sp. MYb227]PQZ94705.1 acetyl/propionyl-CoA carboxylase subunit alpha [Arthrobacter sp. MYb227]
MTSKLFDTVLVANRGEIAVRVIRSLKALGIRSVAVYSDADAGALHVAQADLAIRIGPGPATESYLNTEAILEACQRSGAQAVHPGYGFLSENVGFARACQDAGITFMGPDVHALLLMGDKIRSKNHVAAHGVPVTPGISEPDLSDEELSDAAVEIGFPVLIKPSAGGGGKGMVAVYSAAELPEALASARRTALSSFGDDTLFLERLVSTPRHIEVQILADTHGNTVYLGERECSLQRRHQKVIEESPSPLLEHHSDGARIRAELGAAAVAAAQSVNYVGAGTVEFLVSDEAPGEFFFMEMNTRLQVEHPVTEEVVRVDGQRLDLVQWQVRIAAGEALDFTQDHVQLHGHAIEARVYAEDPAHNFMPSTGIILALTEATGEHIRVDSSLHVGVEIPSFYDPMLSKVITWGTNRAESLTRLDAALASTVVLGVLTNVEYLRLLIADTAVVAGNLDTDLIARIMPGMKFRALSDAELALAAHLSRTDTASTQGPWALGDGWRLGASVGTEIVFEMDLGSRSVTFRKTENGSLSIINGTKFVVESTDSGSYAVNGVIHKVSLATSPDDIVWMSHSGWTAGVRPVLRAESLARELATLDQGSGASSPLVRSPMPGTVIAVQVSDGESVVLGQVLATVEAMKMEHHLLSPSDGVVRMNHLKPGDLVKASQIIATVESETKE